MNKHIKVIKRGNQLKFTGLKIICMGINSHIIQISEEKT